MAEVIDTLTAETPPHEADWDTVDRAIPSWLLPIEQRTDVTVDELERMSLPYSAELYNGKVVFKMPNAEHGAIQTNVSSEIKFYLRESPVGDVFTETNFKLWPNRAKESRIPDVAFVKKGRMPADWRCFPSITPDLAVEIVSAGENFFEVMDKVDAYLEQGAKIVWLIMSIKREVLVCAAGTYHRVRDVLTAPDLLPGFELPVSRIFEGIPLPENS